MDRFTSAISPFIRDFISFRKASGRWNEASYEPFLLIFDRHCKKHFPDSLSLSQEMIDSWCAKRETETNNSCRSRIYVVVSFVRYLRKRGLAKVLEPELPKKERRAYIPHAFTDEELQRFFCACDSIPDTIKTLEQRSRKITIPVFFRLLYSSGIRTTEARLLRVCDVDLDQGVLDIRYSKGHDQHFIALHDSMCELMRRYDFEIGQHYPDRTYFFPARRDGFHTKAWVQVNFKKLWDSCNSTYAVPYELRHNYAVENINRWVGEGFDFDSKLCYLSKSMGHTTLESTKDYYSLVPGMASILEEKTGRGFDDIVPEVSHD